MTFRRFNLARAEFVTLDAGDIRFVIQYKCGKHRNTMPSCHIVMRDIFVAHHVFGVEAEILAGLRDEKREKV
jgi:hypothetical protein